MTSIMRLMKFLLLSFIYWAVGAAFILFTVLPCGMGPDADCEMGNGVTIWLAVIGVVLVYAALCVFLGRRWVAK